MTTRRAPSSSKGSALASAPLRGAMERLAKMRPARSTLVGAKALARALAPPRHHPRGCCHLDRSVCDGGPSASSKGERNKEGGAPPWRGATTIERWRARPALIYKGTPVLDLELANSQFRLPLHNSSWNSGVRIAIPIAIPYHFEMRIGGKRTSQIGTRKEKKK
jgi:hypothetical protein